MPQAVPAPATPQHNLISPNGHTTPILLHGMVTGTAFDTADKGTPNKGTVKAGDEDGDNDFTKRTSTSKIRIFLG